MHQFPVRKGRKFRRSTVLEHAIAMDVPRHFTSHVLREAMQEFVLELFVYNNALSTGFQFFLQIFLMMLAIVAWGAERNEKLSLPEGMTILKAGLLTSSMDIRSQISSRILCDVTLLDISYFIDPRVVGFSVQSLIGASTPFSIAEAVLVYVLGFAE